MMICCIDDTDNLTSKRGTGKLAAMLISDIEAKGWAKGSFIVRHQLFVHPDIPYTSHNSAMSFTLDLLSATPKQILDFAANYLETMREPESDPGLCAAYDLTPHDARRLIAFGQKAKQAVLTKRSAYALAEQCGVHLSEHGGTGMGVIGALAGVGLRLSGTDGRVRGKYFADVSDTVMTVGDILQNSDIQAVTTLDGQELSHQESVLLGEKVKAIFKNNQAVLPVQNTPEHNSAAVWQTCGMEYIKSITG